MTEQEELSEQEQIAELEKPKKQRQKHDISHLRDAVSKDGEFLPKPGERVIVELTSPTGFWLYTTQFVVEWVREDGTVALYDEMRQSQAGVNYKRIGPELKIKLPSR